jgi:hypothetical protein
VSRRRDRARRGKPQTEGGPARGKPPAEGGPARGKPASGAPVGPRLLREVLALVAVFVVAVVLAELFGAANLGVAFGVGQIAFAVALVFILLRR